MKFVRHSDEMEHVRRLSDWLEESTDTGTLDLACCCLRKPSKSYIFVRCVEEHECKLGLEVR